MASAGVFAASPGPAPHTLASQLSGLSDASADSTSVDFQAPWEWGYTGTDSSGSRFSASQQSDDLLQLHRSSHAGSTCGGEVYDSSACQAMCVAAVPAAHAGGVMSLALEADAQGKLLLYSGSDAGDVRVWCHVPANIDDTHRSPPPGGVAPLSCARQQFKVRGDGGAVKSLVVVKDRLYSAHQDRKLRVWKLRGSPTTSSSSGNKKNSKKKLLKGMWRRNRQGDEENERHYEEADEHSAAADNGPTSDDDSDDVAAVAARRRRSPRGGGGLGDDDDDDDGSSKPKKALATLPTFKDYVASFLPPSNYVRVRRHHKSLWIQHADTISVLVPGAGVLYSGSWDKSIKVWRLDDHKCLESLTAAHDDAINALVVDQANAFLYSGGADAKIKVWARILPDGSAIPATPYTTPYLFRKSPHQQHHHHGQQENAYNHGPGGASPSPAALGGSASPCPSDYQHHQQRAPSPLLRSRPSASNLLSPSLLFNRLQQQHINYGRQQPPRKSSSYMSSPAPDMGGCSAHHHQHHHHFKGTTPLHRVLHSSNQHGSHQLVATLEGHGSAINALALSPDGGLLYSASGDATISVWEREDSARHMTFATVLRGHLHAVLALAVSSTSSSSSSGDETTAYVVCSGSADKTIRLWRRVSPTSLRHACVAVLSGHRGPVKSLALREVEQVGTYLYSGGMDGDIRVWWLLLEHGHQQQQQQQVAAGHAYGHHHGYREAHAPGNVVVVPSKSFPPSPSVIRTLCSNQQVV